MDYEINIFLILAIIFIIILLLYYLFNNKKDNNEYLEEKDYSVAYFVREIKDTFNQILNTSLTEYKLDKTETLKEEKRKENLRRALRNCNSGDISAKDYIKEYIKDLLQLKFEINEDNINHIIPYHDSFKLSIQDKFEILIYVYKKDHDENALQELIST